MDANREKISPKALPRLSFQVMRSKNFRLKTRRGWLRAGSMQIAAQPAGSSKDERYLESNRRLDLSRFAHGVVDQRLAQRPDRAGDLVTVGDDGIERGLDPVAVFLSDGQRRQQ